MTTTDRLLDAIDTYMTVSRVYTTPWLPLNPVLRAAGQALDLAMEAERVWPSRADLIAALTYYAKGHAYHTYPDGVTYGARARAALTAALGTHEGGDHDGSETNSDIDRGGPVGRMHVRGVPGTPDGVRGEQLRVLPDALASTWLGREGDAGRAGLLAGACPVDETGRGRGDKAGGAAGMGNWADAAAGAVPDREIAQSRAVPEAFPPLVPEPTAQEADAERLARGAAARWLREHGEERS